MTRAYNVVDADGHILEPVDLWDRYIDPEFRERRPRFVIDNNGKERLSVEGKLLGNPRGIGSLGSVGVRQGLVKANTLKYAEGRPGGCDPHARIVDMDADGIDAAFLYPSLGLFAGAVEDPGLAAAMCRAYNRWLADYCTPYPERLFGVAMLPMQSVDLAVDEMRYARETLGMRGGFLRPNPYHGKKMISDPMYEPFWAMAEALDFSIGFHEGSTNAMPTVGVDRFEEDRAARHMISHTMEMMLAALSVIWGGVVDRHPRLRVAFLESGGGWIAWTGTSMTRVSTSPHRRRGRANCSSAIAGSRSSPSKAASRCWPITSGRTRSCGPRTIRIRTGFSRARRRCCVSALGHCPPRRSIRCSPAARSVSMA